MRSLAALAGIWLLVAGVAGAAAAEPASREIAFVSNAEEGTIALVDVAARKVVGRGKAARPRPDNRDPHSAAGGATALFVALPPKTSPNDS